MPLKLVVDVAKNASNCVQQKPRNRETYNESLEFSPVLAPLIFVTKSDGTI